MGYTGYKAQNAYLTSNENSYINNFKKVPINTFLKNKEILVTVNVSFVIDLFLKPLKTFGFFKSRGQIDSLN